MVANSLGVHLRQLPELNANITLTIDRNEVLDIVDELDDWFLVKTFDGKEGFVSKEFIVTRERPISIRAQKAMELISVAETYLGVPYVYGGNSLPKGTDCSGFTQQLFRLFGVQLPRTAHLQSRVAGIELSSDELTKGDLLFFGTKTRISHVGIYIDENTFIHNSSNNGKVYYDKLNTNPWRSLFVFGKRIF